MDYTIPEKANRVFNIIILGLLLILVRVWYLSVIQHDAQQEKARKPKRRTLVEKMERATIRDRFNIPLALNKIQYNAAVCYADIRQIPSAKWEKGPDGKRIRNPIRATYVKSLASLLASELQMDAQAIEDTIHGKASLFPHTPFILKEDLSEKEYHRLKLLEKEWVGIRTERGSKRYYPLGKVGADVIGYMGAISSKEYYSIAEELKILQTYLAEREAGEIAVLPKGFQNPLQVRERVKALEEKAYTINDLVGKAGVESAFDADLRGFAGKKTYEVDVQGNLLRKLPGGREGVPGQRLLLSISSELQEFAEQLLADNERTREFRHPNGAPDLSTPFIKGGAIVALDPKTGEVLALASYPRIDPNDFIPSRVPDVKASKQAAVAKWLENETYIAEIWDGKRALTRERFDRSTETFFEEGISLSLDQYFEAILPPQSSLSFAMQNISSVGQALALQEDMQTLLRMSGQEKMHAVIDALYAEKPHRASKQGTSSEERSKILQQGIASSAAKKRVDAVLGQISCNEDKLLVVDLCRMLVDRTRFSPELVAHTSSLSLAGYRLLNQSAAIVQTHLQSSAKAQFHACDFQQWREAHFKEYLKEKRREEKQKHRYAKPYTEYLDQIERQMFSSFWKERRLSLMYAFIMEDAAAAGEIQKHIERLKMALKSLPQEQRVAFLKTMRSFHELDRPLYGRYRSLRHTEGVQLEKHLAAAFYPLAGYGYGRSQAFRQSTPQGSLFKLVVAYQGLRELYHNHKADHLNPLTLIDSIQWHPKEGCNEQVLGYTLEGQPITRLYKGGRLPRTRRNRGKIDIIGAIETSSNIYFSILANEHLSDPLNLVKAASEFGFGEKTGIELPAEISGVLPDDVSYNLTGLYSFAMGQHSLVVTPLQTALMLSAIANKGHILKPKVIQVIAGQEPLREYRDPFAQGSYPFQEHLAAIGIHFPLFTATQAEEGDPYVWYNTPEVKRVLEMPSAVRDPMITGMHRVINSPKGTCRPQIIHALGENSHWMRNFLALKDNLIGKTGTAEILYKQTIDAESEAKIQNHIWFGGVAFSPEQPQSFENPELALVVYLRFSESGGKEAAPLATEIVKKWHEICERHGRSAHVSNEVRIPPLIDQSNRW